MIDIERALRDKAPGLAARPPWLFGPLVAGLRRLVHEREINDFLARHGELGWCEFIDRVFEHLDVGYTLSSKDREQIPETGRVVVVANHPLGALDGLALLRMVAEVRPDVSILANDLLLQLAPLSDVIVPVDNLSRRGLRRSLARMTEALEAERAVIVFPAGEVSRAGPRGVRDGRWHSGFLHAARRTNAPLLPVHVRGRNSSRFYALTSLRSDVGTLLLPGEMFRQRGRHIALRAGGPIPLAQFDRDDLATPVKLRLLRKHVYRLGRGKRGVFVGETGIARPEPRQALREELRDAESLGETADGKRILLVDSHPDSAVMREIGRLREVAFRRVGRAAAASATWTSSMPITATWCCGTTATWRSPAPIGSARWGGSSSATASRGSTARPSSIWSRRPGRSGATAWSSAAASSSRATGGGAAWTICGSASGPTCVAIPRCAGCSGR